MNDLKGDGRINLGWILGRYVVRTEVSGSFMSN